MIEEEAPVRLNVSEFYRKKFHYPVNHHMLIIFSSLSTKLIKIFKYSSMPKFWKIKFHILMFQILELLKQSNF